MNSLSDEDKKNLIVRLRRVEGQVRGLQRMIDQEKYCVDILTQINACRGALKKVGLKILDRHVNGCVKNAISQEEGEEEIISELMDVLDKFTD
ncbi:MULTISPECIES: metal-sensitive transcriptional regulator [Halanaerobium]|jgi:DNA-binding FrmR family transcriptional regulator|uniref:DNA-binding transcriptional regulator, FrmR family n=1 Tax=Halanaerobium kushneri TaxID=56779 RepID=A0A1N6VS50_9FIRM|nr:MULTISPECIES: metal-sensitive transcriptional regulator [Halanaerobium]RCW56542.1 DNA-binding FrmR family transcriptional regulator [Halanaerobium sp. ST460_2HS_T2]SIQ80598.1 DNA-binding transcriptional regulator, FrmR family [Halanaerobium kushneri]